MTIGENILHSLSRFSLFDALDIILMAVLIYYVLKLASRTRGMQVLKGMGILVIAWWVSDWMGLTAFTWVLNYLINASPVVMLILFLPELRRLLEQLGRGRLIDSILTVEGEPDYVAELVRALLNLSKHRQGALVVIQRYVALEDIIETGVPVGGLVMASLLESIFMPGTPLHDGAVIIKDSTVVAAGCFLPLTDNQMLPKELGTRHRAALGLSEVFDGVVFVVSEESGIISMASEGHLTRNLNAAAIRSAILGDQDANGGNGLIERLRRLRRNGQ